MKPDMNLKFNSVVSFIYCLALLALLQHCISTCVQTANTNQCNVSNQLEVEQTDPVSNTSPLEIITPRKLGKVRGKYDPKLTVERPDLSLFSKVLPIIVVSAVIGMFLGRGLARTYYDWSEPPYRPITASDFHWYYYHQVPYMDIPNIIDTYAPTWALPYPERFNLPTTDSKGKPLEYLAGWIMPTNIEEFMGKYSTWCSSTDGLYVHEAAMGASVAVAGKMIRFGHTKDDFNAGQSLWISITDHSKPLNIIVRPLATNSDSDTAAKTRFAAYITTDNWNDVADAEDFPAELKERLTLVDRVVDAIWQTSKKQRKESTVKKKRLLEYQS